MVKRILIDCNRGQSAHRPVLLGFAPADLLYRLSFPDILNEDTGKGYQRPSTIATARIFGVHQSAGPARRFR